MLMLTGFVYFAAFLGKFAELMSQLASSSSPSSNSNIRKRLFQSLMERLEYVDPIEDDEEGMDEYADDREKALQRNDPLD